MVIEISLDVVFETFHINSTPGFIDIFPGVCLFGERIMRKINMNDELLEWVFDQSVIENTCLVWTRSCDRSGYGRIRYQRRSWKAHRLVYHLTNPDYDIMGLEVMHSCDNPPCVRPSHLSLGTRQDNVDDMILKGRGNYSKGESNGKSKLTQMEVKEIKRVYKRIWGQQAALAREYGVSREQINKIVNNKEWK